MNSAYSRFHVKQAAYGMREFALSFKGSMEVILLVAGQVILMVVALLAWPIWMSAIWLREHMILSYIATIIVAYSGLMALPIFLLRKRILPRDTFVWEQPLPITQRMRWCAHAAVLRLFVLPLGAGHVMSSIVCWMQIPATHAVWVSALVLLVISLLLMFVFGTLILEWRYRSLMRHARSKVLSEVPLVLCRPYQQLPWEPRLLQQWYHLFFLPFWRLENGIGIQQVILFILSVTLFSMWCIVSTPIVRAFFCVSAISFTLILTDQGVKALQEHWRAIQPVLRALPFKLYQLRVLNSFFCLLPVGISLAWLGVLLFAQANNVHVGVAFWFVAMSLLGHIILVSFVNLSSPARARMVLFLIVLLSAFGSEIWK